MGVNNLLREITGVYVQFSDSYTHHELTESFTKKNERIVYKNVFDLLKKEGFHSALLVQIYSISLIPNK